MDIFVLAEQQLQREGIYPSNKTFGKLFVDRAVKIRNFLIKQQTNKAIAIARYSKNK